MKIFQYLNHRMGVLFLLTKYKEVDMDKKDLKKLLAGLSIVSLIAGAGLSVTGCASTA
jgi:radical SAM modification target selenobiotic family peptide